MNPSEEIILQILALYEKYVKILTSRKLFEHIPEDLKDVIVEEYYKLPIISAGQATQLPPPIQCEDGDSSRELVKIQISGQTWILNFLPEILENFNYILIQYGATMSYYFPCNPNTRGEVETYSDPNQSPQKKANSAILLSVVQDVYNVDHENTKITTEGSQPPNPEVTIKSEQESQVPDSETQDLGLNPLEMDEDIFFLDS
jgi:hypothetical protein